MPASVKHRFIVSKTTADHKPFGIFDRDQQRFVASYADPRDVRDALVTYYGWTPAQARALDIEGIVFGDKSLSDDLREQGLTPADLNRSDVRADVLAAGWTEEDAAKLAHPASTEDGAVSHGGNPLAATIEDATGDDNVSDDDATGVLEWCRLWVADCYGAGTEDEVGPEALLRYCQRHIDGGLRFVLEDVRRVASTDGLDKRYAEAPRMMCEPAGSGDEHEAMRAAIPSS